MIFFIASCLSLYHVCSQIVTIVILQVLNLIGDVKGKVAVMVDDMIDTAG